MKFCKSDIKVSIITVCYNSQETIRDTIESVLKQTYPNVEYIIVDGASTDHTMDIIKEYQCKFDGRLQVVSEPDSGIYDAMNKGIDLAAGRIIGIINSDDYYELNAVEKIVERYSNEEFAVLYGMVRTWRNNMEEEVSLLSHNFLQERMIAHPGCFVTKAVYDKIAKYNTERISAADYEFMLQIARTGLVTFIPVYSIIANYRLGGISNRPQGFLDSLAVKKEYGVISNREYWKQIIVTKILQVKERFWCHDRKC